MTSTVGAWADYSVTLPDDENQYYIYVGSQNDTIMSIPSESAFKNEGDNWVPIKF